MLTAEQIKKAVVSESGEPISISAMADRLKMKDSKLLSNVFAKHQITPVLRAGGKTRRYCFYTLTDEQGNTIAEDVMSRLEARRQAKEIKAAQRQAMKAIRQQGIVQSQPIADTSNERMDRVEETLRRHSAIMEKLAAAWGIVA
jgi:hypothetical protein